MTEQSVTSGDVNVKDTGADVNTTSENQEANQEERIFSQKDVDKIMEQLEVVKDKVRANGKID